ncbi:hypothetical protein ElyMa_001539000 [Elysia marginata]|uniref:Uncharacterized protein n=1 Tax=Elysia marginata TaxID=1093978 RepID=A0AAV4JCG3_9GAST|nr:hypothetical protein ElyMa_001539000 [Elysia marginata]
MVHVESDGKVKNQQMTFGIATRIDLLNFIPSYDTEPWVGGEKSLHFAIDDGDDYDNDDDDDNGGDDNCDGDNDT